MPSKYRIDRLKDSLKIMSEKCEVLINSKVQWGNNIVKKIEKLKRA